MHYPDTKLFIGGEWREGRRGRVLGVENPSTGLDVGKVHVAELSDLDDAVAASVDGFAKWRLQTPMERAKVLRNAADLMRSRAAEIGPLITIEQGKRLAEAVGEAAGAADSIEWCAEEGRRAYGRILPSRRNDTETLVFREPVGPVAAFSPWNFPINQAVKKVAAALAAGCSIILKGPEETPASVAAMVQAFVDAGVPAGVISLVFGEPAVISEHLIAHPDVKKVSFTGSTAVGKQLAALAGKHMKRATMELGGHAPAIICSDADIASAAKLLSVQKFWNAGQACISPSRFLVQSGVYDAFLEAFTSQAKKIKVGDGLDKETRMGPLANRRRVDAMHRLVDDAVGKGATLHLGGKRIGNAGHFFEPTILTEVPTTAMVMNEEPFGPIAAFSRFDGVDEAITEANRLAYGLAAYVFTKSTATTLEFAHSVSSGSIGVNSISIGFPEMPFGGLNDSGIGTEGGEDVLDGYLNTKVISLGN